jgi:hypothetical protein
MKKFTYPIVFMMLMLVTGILNLNAQNLMVNGNLESWTSGVPDGWNVYENITQGTTVHGGNFSAQHTSASSTKDFQQVISGLQGGEEYTIEYWYYDNDPAARTRIWSYWLEGTTTLQDHADTLRPSTYSEDNSAWQHWYYVLTAPPTADGFRFEVRVYNQSGNTGGSVYYDDFLFSGDVTILPEPSNYPTDFSAAASGLTVSLTWSDATGTQLPTAYIILAGTTFNLPVPADGIPILNDLDLSDGDGALNVDFGVEEALFSNLTANTIYYFTIYPYTNGSANIDYKTDGTAPAAVATTANIQIMNSENFNEGWGDWTTVSVIGTQVWDRNNTYGMGGTPCASMDGYETGYFENEDWLISPSLDLSQYDNEMLAFYNSKNYTGPDLVLKISTDYTGSGDPNNATWTDLAFTKSPGNWAWTYSGDISISSFTGSSSYIAFYYISTTTESATWEIDDIVITGEGNYIPDPEPSNYPTTFTATPQGLSVVLYWTDATGIQLPDQYLILGNETGVFQVPQDGQPVANDPDLSDGEGAMNVNYGAQTYTFGTLDPNTLYYFVIFPYTNSGSYIDFKNDGTAPTAQATTPNTTTVTLNAENFDSGWGDWTAISVIGSQVWDRNNTYGVNNSPCAQMSGYEGGTFYANEDWLISPPMDFDNYYNETLAFQTAKNYAGPDLQILISNDYNGGGSPGSATWTALSATLSTGNFTWTPSGDVDISSFTGDEVYVAFKFTSTSSSSATWEVDEIEITAQEEVSIYNPVNEDLALVLFPNPTTGIMFVERSSDKPADLRIFDRLGEQVLETMLDGKVNRMDLTTLEKGVYFVSILTEDNQLITRKLVIQ